MCGILGQLNTHRKIDSVSFNEMLDQLASRGPDGMGVQLLSNDFVALGHRRLSIIDLSTDGSQPITNEDGTLWLVFNGEIYNFKKLRAELEKLGHIFKSNTDSEVIIHGYESWGSALVHKLRGIFAFGIYNTLNNEIFLARDHAGVKPLYYMHNNNTFVFASETKPILKCNLYQKEVDNEGLQLYLKYGNLPSSYSIFKNIKKLLPGHFLLYKLGDKVEISRYWKLEYNPIIRNRKEAIDAIFEKIQESVIAQTASDVPIGCLLSGGVDSTIITGILTKELSYQLATYNIGFDIKNSDESVYAKLIADHYNTNHHVKHLNANDAIKTINNLVDIFDEPFHLNAIIPYLNISNLVSSNNYKVVMGGDGADELFAGYLWYEKYDKWHALNKPNFLTSKIFSNRKSDFKKKSIDQFTNYNSHLSDTLIQKYTNNFDYDLIYNITEKHYIHDINPVLAAQIVDFNCFIPDHCLTKVDKTSMSCGVEVRVPFLDIELIDLIFKIDHNLIYKNKERKALLKESMASFLPKEMNTSRKKGFSSPISKWLKDEFLENGFKMLNDGCLFSSNMVDADAVKNSFKDLSAANQLLLIGLEMWTKKWIYNESVEL